MTARLLLLASACLCAAALVPAVASGYQNPYAISGEHSLVWEEESLRVEAHVSGEGMEEGTRPCATCPPLIANPLPRGLTIRFSRSCMSGGWAYRPETTTNWMPGATVNAVRGVVTFDLTEAFPVYPEEAPFGRFCLVRSMSTSQPNQECAEYFNPELCATEYGTSKSVLEVGYMSFVPTPTARCRPAKAAAARALKRIKTVTKSLRRVPGRQPPVEARLEEMRRDYRYWAKGRVIGECK